MYDIIFAANLIKTILLHRIYLIGYMGSGKSTIAAALSERLSWDWIDIDEVISTRSGLSIPEIFRRYGEEDFRSLESSALHRSISQEHVVIATGGGAPCHNDNLQLMKESGELVYLKCHVQTLEQRLVEESHLRPLIAGLSKRELPVYIEKHLTEREEFYNQADYIIDADNQVDQVVSSIVETL